jgi:hypothetical protein
MYSFKEYRLFVEAERNQVKGYGVFDPGASMELRYSDEGG